MVRVSALLLVLCLLGGIAEAGEEPTNEDFDIWVEDASTADNPHVALIVAAPALAFHDNGVAHCNGCHTMHNSEDGAPMNYDATGTADGLVSRKRRLNHVENRADVDDCAALPRVFPKHTHADAKRRG